MKEKFMRLAIKEARLGAKKGEVPIGCVIVKDGEVIAKAHNLRQKKRVATSHAEILAIEKACKKIGDWRLDSCEIYVTLEPCVMCAGAMINARLKKVYFGANEPKGGAAVSKFNILDSGVLNWSCEFEGGVLEEECSSLLTSFFQKRRTENSLSNGNKDE